MQNGKDFKSKGGSYSDDSILSQGGAGIELGGDLRGSTPTVIKSREDLERYIRSLPAQDQNGVRLEVQSAIDAERNRLYRESRKSFKTYGRFGFDKTGIASARSIAIDSARGRVARGEIKNIAAKATDLVTDVDRPGQIEAESFRRETGRLSAQQPIRNAQADAEAAEAAAEAAKERRESANSLAQLRTLARAINSQVAQADRSLKQVQEEIRVAVGTPIATSKKQKENEFASSNAKKITLRQLRKDERALAASLAKLKKEQKMATEKANQGRRG